MKKNWIPLLILTSAPGFAQEDLTIKQRIETMIKHPTVQTIKNNIRFSYGIKYLGRPLGGNNQEGSTYNRFSSGQDWKNTEMDATSSTQMYHAFSFGYQVSRNLKVSFSSTYQDDLNKGVKYKDYWPDGSLNKISERSQGVSHNNKRLNAFITNIYSNTYLFLMSNFYYEFPTTDTSENYEMLYGLGFQPTIGIFSNVPKLFHGFKFSFERDYYKNQEFYGHPNDKYPTRRTTFRASVGPYVGYNISDKLSVKTEFTFDWDKKGDQIENTNEFNKNMDDVIELSSTYHLSRNMSLGAGIQKAITDPKPEKSAILGYLNLSL